MKIGIDIMGGDYAPEVTIQGAILALDRLSSDVELVLIGDEKRIKELLKKEGCSSNHYSICNTSQVIEMGEHPAKAFSAKTDSSIVKGYKLLAQNKIDGFASTGNTGAMLVGAMYSAKSIPGIIRPCISSALPREGKQNSLLLDVGINPDCRPDVLYQYAILGSIYFESVFGVKKPKVGLLNIGSEEGKGNLLTKATYENMKGSSDFNFIGNIEGNELFSSNKFDIVVCDGFTGNVVLKEAEAFYSLIKKRNIHDEFFEKFNFENYGGTPILGINAPVIIGHGISGKIAIKNMILHTKEVIDANLPEKFKKIFK